MNQNTDQTQRHSLLANPSISVGMPQPQSAPQQQMLQPQQLYQQSHFFQTQTQQQQQQQKPQQSHEVQQADSQAYTGSLTDDKQNGAKAYTSLLFKTKLCTFWKKGRCGRMTDCRFAHGEAELASPPDFSRTKMCNFMQGGKCRDTNCKFAHSFSELRGSSTNEELPEYTSSGPVVGAVNFQNPVPVPSPSPQQSQAQMPVGGFGSGPYRSAPVPLQLDQSLDLGPSPSPTLLRVFSDGQSSSVPGGDQNIPTVSSLPAMGPTLSQQSIGLYPTLPTFTCQREGSPHTAGSTTSTSNGDASGIAEAEMRATFYEDSEGMPEPETERKGIRADILSETEGIKSVLESLSRGEADPRSGTMLKNFIESLIVRARHRQASEASGDSTLKEAWGEQRLLEESILLMSSPSFYED